ncbi:MAG: SUMF1/EgtB/PvdO family nonheme iron enzyme [Caldilineaceae bacterium]|nr:SUMF1/EgtB/PvdO family nonheme iron enzyme [Caldilineaceae bacterium]
MTEPSREEELLAEIERLKQELAAREVGARGAGGDVSGGALTTGGYNQVDTSHTVFGQGNQQVQQQINVAGDFKITEQVAQQLLERLQPDAVAAQDLQPVTEHYLAHVVSRYQYLDFKGMGMADRVALKLPLVQMYVPLQARIEMPSGETWARDLRVGGRRVSEEEALAMGERLSAPTALIALLERHDGLVILGDPGAGKTTFLKYLTLKLALGQGEELGLAQRLPVLVPLSAYANALAEGDVALQTFLGGYYEKRGIDLPMTQLLAAALGQGRALLLLDGLDEVQELQRRHLVVERVESFVAHHRQQGNKFLLSSRIVGYRQVRLSCEGLAECTLVDFDEDDIGDFVTKWTSAIERAAHGDTAQAQREAEEERSELLFAVEHNPGVRQLASNPLLLTILALMKRQGVALPERRAQLYERYVETLLRHWNLVRGLDRRAARDLDVVETQRVLAPLALWMHETSPGVGLVKREDVRRKLVEIYEGRGADDSERAAEQLLADARDHASVLLERGPGEYGFIHLTFQEYLAAVAIAQLGQRDIGPVVAQLAAHVDDDTWRETSLLTIGYMGLVQQRDEAAGETLLRLVEEAPGAPGAALLLAGQAVADVGLGGVTQPCRSRVTEALHTAMLDSSLEMRTRARAGSVLGAVGDPRDLEEMVPVPGGLFVMGTSDEQGEVAVREQMAVRPKDAWYDEKNVQGWIELEKPQHTIHVPDFRISKYAVTNGQYARFVAASGHEPPTHWRGARPPANLRNHPVVNVSWYDAVAYCKWLSQKRGEEVRLPTEAEWEKAARGPATGSGSTQIYPWLGPFDAAKCNMDETGIDGTSPVGIFVDGASPYGCLDMAGNMFEWCLTKWRDNYVDYVNSVDNSLEGDDRRVLRGGAFYDARVAMRCASRLDLDPRNRLNGVGLRVVSPGLCGAGR